MKTRTAALGAAAVFGMFLYGIALANPDTTRVPATNGRSGRVVTIPAHAVEVTPGVFSLGTSTDVDGRAVEGYMVFHHRDGHGGGPGGGGGGETCYAFLAKDAKWRTVEPWVMNPANAQGLPGATLFANQAASLEKWEGPPGAAIFGEGTMTDTPLIADEESPDGVNEVYFGSIDSPGAIAVTIVWGIFGGPPWQRALVEWDQVYDEADFDWSLAGEASKMDFENIATHEDGHAAGMGHPSDSCTEETMYRFAGEGETKKRDLHTGDIAGINKLY